MVHRSPPDIDASLLSYLQDMAGNAEIENNDVLLEEALCMVESIVASGEISAANAGVIYSILLSLVKIGYKGDILNEGTLKAWRLFSKALVGGAVLADKRVLSEFGSLLSRYCEEGMMALCVNLDMTLNDLDSYIEQELTTMKLVGFFGLRLSELVFHKFKELNADNISASMSLLLRYTGILHTIGKHTSSISTLIAKSCQFFERMLSNDVEHLLPALLRSFASAEGFNETDRISSFYTILGALRVSLYLLQSMAAQEERTASIELVCGCIYLNIAAASILTMVHGGTLTDSDLLEIMGSAVDAICTTLGRLQSPQELVTAVNVLTGMSCAAGSSVVAVQATQASMCLLARQMLCGVLASFRYEESDLDNASLPFQSCCITNIVWEYCKRQMECHIDSPKLQLVQVFRTVRAVLLVVDNRTGRELVQEILTFAQVLNPLGDDGSISPCMRSIWPVQVREGILAYLPLAHIVRDGSEDTVLMLRHVAQKSVQEIERFGGAAAGAASSTGFVAHGEGVAQVWDGIQVGSALSVLVATAGFHSSARGAAEALQRVHSCWRECLESLRGNVFVGTSLLRWISSLSEHIQTLALAGDDRASGGGVGGKGGAGLNIARVQRVSSVAAVLTALVRCLWSHSVPRAVQQVLSKAAASCCEAVHRLLAVQPSASRHGSDQVLVSNTAVQLMEFITTTMKVVVGPNFSEKSIESVKAVYASWAAACNTALHLNAAQQWRYWTLFLTSLQQFANALPAPLKPRARELVTPDLVPLIQSRALGRTYSLTQTTEVALSPAESALVVRQMLQQSEHGPASSVVDCFENLSAQVRISLGGNAVDEEEPVVGDAASESNGKSAKRPRCAMQTPVEPPRQVPRYNDVTYTASQLNTLMRQSHDLHGGLMPILHAQLEVEGAMQQDSQSSVRAALLLLGDQQLEEMCALTGDGAFAVVATTRPVTILQNVSGVTARVGVQQVVQERGEFLPDLDSGNEGQEIFSNTAQSEAGGEDTNSVENGIIMSQGRRYPLLIDHQHQPSFSLSFKDVAVEEHGMTPT